MYSLERSWTMDWRPYFCGLCFGIYPILAARSKLTSDASFFAFSMIGCAFALALFAQSGITAISSASILQLGLITASYFGSAIGLLWMFRYLHDTPPERVGSLVIIMVITQVVVTWIASLLLGKTTLNKNQAIGVMLAAISIFFLQK
jgi:drug/metabolite transporter (DMT)-like permease